MKEKEIKVWVEFLPDTIIGYDSEDNEVSISEYYDSDILLEPCGFEMDPESSYDFWCEVDEWFCETFCDEDLEYEGGCDKEFIIYPVVDGEILWDIVLYDGSVGETIYNGNRLEKPLEVMYNGEILWDKVVEETIGHPVYKIHMREKRLLELFGE